MYKATNRDSQFEIELVKETTVNGVVKDIQFAKLSNGSFMLTVDGKRKEADLVKLDKEAKQVVLRIEGKKYTVSIKEPVDVLLDKLGIKNVAGKKVNQLKAPMPGMIIKVLAKKGDTIKQGEPLLILEAMKMENVFKAAADVTVKEISIEERQTVEKGQVLMTFE